MQLNKMFRKKIRIFSLIAIIMMFAGTFVYGENDNLNWDNPAQINKTDGRFPVTINNGSDSYVFWQKVNSKSKTIQLMVRHYTAESVFRERQLFGTFAYSGEVPDLYTVAISKSGTIIVAAQSSEGITIFTSRDKCETFFKKVIRTSRPIVGPKVYVTNDGRFRLFYSLVDYKKSEKKNLPTVTSENDEMVANEIEISENQVNTDIDKTENSSETQSEVTTVEQEPESQTRELDMQSFQLYYIDSYDGQTWTDGVQLEMPDGVKNPFSPYLIPSSNGDLVVFQAQVSTGGLTHYQLFKTVFYNNKPGDIKQLCFSKSVSQDQRPVMFKYNGENYIVWEHTTNTETLLQIANIGVNGLVSKIENISKSNGKANRGRFFVFDDELYLSWFDANEGKTYLKRLVNKKGIKVYEDISSVNNLQNILFPNPLILKKADGSSCLYFICQQKVGSAGRISLLGPDRFVGLPELVLTKGKRRSAKKDVEITINYPSDASGIKGFVYYWGLDDTVEPELDIEKILLTGPKNYIFKGVAEEDGIYNLKVRIADGAGNWSSKSVGIDYYHDITPPSKPELDPSCFDEYGFVKANEFNLKWFVSKDENKRPGESEKDAAGYTYELVPLGKIPESLVVNKTHSITMSKARVEAELKKLKDKYSKQVNKSYNFKPVIQTPNTSTKKYINYENGVYRFSIAAIDEVGNISDSTSQLIFINKYKPQTKIERAFISKITKKGDIIASIIGEGFTYEGTITKIYFDADGVKNKNGHYDLELSRDKNEFIVSSDKKITDINIGAALKKGSYKVGVYHSDRGLYFTNVPILTISDKVGTVVFNPEYEYRTKYHEIQINYKYTILIDFILVLLIIALIVVIVIAFLLVFTGYTKEKIIVNKEINSLITGEDMPTLKTKIKKNRQRSLRGKIVGFTVVLIILIVGIITIINVQSTLRNQGQFLSESLKDRVDSLLGIVDSAVTRYMPDTETDDEATRNTAIRNITSLPDQRKALPEAQYLTILGKKNKYSGLKNSDSENMVYVWTTDDEQQDIKFVNQDDDSNQFDNGVTQIIVDQPLNNDLLAIIERTKNLDKDAKNRTKAITEEINKLKFEFLSLPDPDDYTKQDSQNKLENQLIELYSSIEDEYKGSIPEFNGVSLGMEANDYLFYKPILYSPIGGQDSDDKVYNGLLILEVNVETLQENLRNQVNDIVISGLIIALFAIIAGVVGSWILAGIIVRPIKKLETHIQDVGNLLTKSARERMRLQKMEIKVTSKDEVGRLGEVVNKMSSTVGKAAEDELLEADGKVVQQKFIPLENGEGKYKLPIVKHFEEKIELYAFYKGDSDVSGDYFDYQKLDDRWYVFIKCDVSGHGTPAALLVSVLSTKFREYYYNSRWNYNKDGINLVEFVSEVNDFIYDLGTRGKFSTINISLYNKDTGELYTCNAGDNKLDIFESDKRHLRRITLANTPAAGGVSTDLVQMKGGFRVEKTMLRHGDTLFMYSDGIDEAERLVRNKDFSVKTHVVETKKFNPRENKEEIETSVEELKEQFGEERYRRVVEAVMNRRKFILDKEENPTKEILEFDFTNCKGTLDEAIIALASIERVFRMYKSPEVKAGDEIEIEKLLDEFLKEHFALYLTYCKPAVIVEENDNSSKKGKKKEEKNVNAKKADEDLNVTRYGYIFEDKQADDITLVAIHRP